MNFLIIGRGKTGALVADVARERNHEVTVIGAAENPDGSWITKESAKPFDCAIDFTAPEVALKNISACARAGLNVVVGTTGWYDEIDYVKQLVDSSGIGLLYSPNFSFGVNVFLEVARGIGTAAQLGYKMTIVEQHHAQKKDKPSGTAIAIQNAIAQTAGFKPEIGSIREGDIIGMHVILLEGQDDMMMFTHKAENRRGFAVGAVTAAEWLSNKKGLFTFRDMLTAQSSAEQ